MPGTGGGASGAAAGKSGARNPLGAIVELPIASASELISDEKANLSPASLTTKALTISNETLCFPRSF